MVLSSEAFKDFLLKYLDSQVVIPKCLTHDYKIETSPSSNPFSCTIKAISCLSIQDPHNVYIFKVPLSYDSERF